MGVRRCGSWILLSRPDRLTGQIRDKIRQDIGRLLSRPVERPAGWPMAREKRLERLGLAATHPGKHPGRRRDLGGLVAEAAAGAEGGSSACDACLELADALREHGLAGAHAGGHREISAE